MLLVQHWAPRTNRFYKMNKMLAFGEMSHLFNMTTQLAASYIALAILQEYF